MLNRFYLFYISVFLFFFFSLLLSTYGVPLAAPSLCPIEARPFVRDFGSLIPALRGRRLLNRLGG